MRMYAVYRKSEELSYLSHLDIQRTLQRAFRRADIPLAYSEGFNPHPQFSFAAAVPTGTASNCEWFEVRLTENILPEDFLKRVAGALTPGLSILSAREVPENAGKLTTLVRAAGYSVRLNVPCSQDEVIHALDELLSGEIVVVKKTKGGEKPADIRPMILSASVAGQSDNGDIILYLMGKLQTDGGLRVSHLTDVLLDRLHCSGSPVFIERTAMYFETGHDLPVMPGETDVTNE